MATKKKNAVTDYDVRVSVYNSVRGDVACIRFMNNLDMLLECNFKDHVKLVEKTVKNEKRLYFMIVSQTVHGSGQSCITKNKLQYTRDEQVIICKKFEGVYPLNYDSAENMYYLALDERREAPTYNSRAGISHNYGKRADVDRGVQRTGWKKSPKVEGRAKPVDDKVKPAEKPVPTPIKPEKPTPKAFVKARGVNPVEKPVEQPQGDVKEYKRQMIFRLLGELDVKDDKTALVVQLIKELLNETN